MKDSPDREVIVFNAALDLAAEQRAAYLDQACAGDQALRARVEALLRVHHEVGAFLENPTRLPGPPAAAETPGPGRAIGLPALSADKTGGRIGRYKLLQQIGEGGCGVVYMAEQEEPVRRKVALKIIKLGMDTRHVIARFEAERQALALMDHPNIARVLDAGATDTGRPFFVMELVRGIKITEFCDQNHLPTNARLKLFTQVCQAIQHAHQKGVIHRDIKPSNILVADHDGVPVPKVIDFGIAKATTDQPLTDKTLFTALEQFMGTPAYMSPEQARLSGLDIDTRTDIYSLGVLLYELLTGKTPFDATKLLAAGLEEMRRTIREQEPERPSTRLSTMLAAELTDVACRRQCEAPKLVHLIRGDLDWIVMKCLEKDRSRRYETANGLAFDIQRHLRNELVEARPPSSLYRLQKLFLRNKAAFTAGVAISVSLLIGLVVSTSLFLAESKARRRALVAEQIAEAAQAGATEQPWHSDHPPARATRFNGQPGRRFDSLAALAKAKAIRFAPELRDEAIAALALPDLKLQRRIQVNGGVFDRDLERYATILTNSGEVSIRSTIDDREFYRLPSPKGRSKNLICGHFSHNGKYLPVWDADKLLSVWDLDRRDVILALTRPTESADFLPDDAGLAAPDEKGVNLYRLPSGQKAATFPIPFDPMWVRFDPSGHKLAVSSSWDHRLAVLDIQSGLTQWAVTNTELLGDTAWSPRSSMLATLGQETGLIYLLDADTGRQLFALKGHQNTPGTVLFSQDGQLLLSSGWDGTHLWHARTGEHQVWYDVPGVFQSFAPDDDVVGHTCYHNGPLELLSFASGREAGRWHAGEEDRHDKVIAFSPDGRWLAFGAGEVVELFDARTAELLATLPTGPSLGLCFQKSGRGLLVSGDRGLNLWPLRPAEAENELILGPPQPVGSPGAWEHATLSGDGRVFAAYHEDHVCLFEGDSLREMARTGVCGHQNQFRFLSLSADGLKLATGRWHDSGVKIWNAHTGALIKELADPDWLPDGSPTPMFEPNGNSLVVAGWENYRVWETNSWTPGPRHPRAGLANMALSHRGKLLAMALGQTAIQLRDVESGEVLATLQSPIPNHLTALAFSPDDTQLAVVHWGTRDLLVWDLRLLREDLSKLGLDWSRPPYPAPVEAVAAIPFRIRVLTN